MQKFFTLPLFLLLLAVTGFGQITITFDDVFNTGINVTEAHDTLPDASILAGEPGAHQSWDFSKLKSSEEFSFVTKAAAGTPHHGLFPFANFVAVQDGKNYTYFALDGQSLRHIGSYGTFDFDSVSFEVAAFLNPWNNVIKFPANYMDVFNQNFKREITISGEIFGGGIDSFRIVSQVKRTVNIDAFGSLKTPEHTFDVLRFNEQEITLDSFYLLFNGMWVPTPNDAPADTSVTYNFWTKQNGIGFPVVTLGTDASGTTVWANWLKGIATTPVKEAPAALDVQVYPNPAANELTVKVPGGFNGRIELYNLAGKMVRMQEIQHGNSSLDLRQLAPGSYFLVLKNNKNRIAGHQRFEVAR